MKIVKVDKQISFPKPKSGLFLTPTKFFEGLIEKIDYQDRRFVIKQVIKIKIISINYFCLVLRHIQTCRKGVSLP